MEVHSIATPDATAIQPLDHPDALADSPPIQITPPFIFDRIPDEILLRFTYIASETDPEDYYGPGSSLYAPPSLGPVADGLSKVCARWHAAIQGKSNQLLWHFGVRVDLWAINLLGREDARLSRFKHRLSISRGYSIYATIAFTNDPVAHGPPPAAAHLGAIALRLLEPYRHRVTLLYFNNSIPLLNLPSVAFNSYARLQTLIIDLAPSDSLEPFTLDPQGILSFLYSTDSNPVPLNSVSRLQVVGGVAHIWPHLPSGHSLQQLILADYKKCPFKCQDLTAFLLSNPNLRFLKFLHIDVIWDKQTIPTSRAPLRLEEIHIAGKPDIAMYLLSTFTQDQLEKVYLNLSEWDVPPDKVLLAQRSFPSLQFITMESATLNDQFMPLLSNPKEMTQLKLTIPLGYWSDLSAITSARNIDLFWRSASLNTGLSDRLSHLALPKLDKAEALTLFLYEQGVSTSAPSTPTRPVFQQTPIPGAESLDAPLLRSVNVRVSSRTLGDTNLTMFTTWIHSFSAPKLREASFEVFGVRRSSTLSISLKYLGEAIVPKEWPVTDVQHLLASELPETRKLVSLVLSLDMRSHPHTSKYEAESGVALTFLKELEPGLQGIPLFPTIDSLTIELTGSFDEEHAPRFKKALQSLKASRTACGFPIAKVDLVEDAASLFLVARP
jgi:hypothetical protein